MITIAAQSKAKLYSLHGHPIRLRCESAFLANAVNHLLGEFAIPSLPAGASAVEGIVKLYQPDEVVRRLPSNAARLSPPGELTEIYQQDELYWLIDDRWGIAEINLLKGQWRSWVVPQPILEPQRALAPAVLWPLTQLLRGKGLTLVPAASCVRDGWGLLMIAQASIEPQLVALVRAGFRIVGQSWTALREDAGQISLLRLPGQVERVPAASIEPSGANPTNRTAPPPPSAPVWVDLTHEFCGASANHARCDAVFLVDRARRPVAHLKALPRTNAVIGLRRAWPVMQLHAQRRLSQLHARMARECKCFEARFSRNPQDVLRLVEDARYNRVSAVEATVHVHPQAQSRRVVA